ncbi:MAG: hypothetical protein AAGC70_07120 [Pseudomonadota bacterium]
MYRNENLAALLCCAVMFFPSAPTSADVLGPGRAKLKRDYIASLTAQTGGQLVLLPLRDGRKISLTMQYVFDGEGIRIKRQRDDSVCVTFDRLKVAVAGLSQDAMLNCAQLNACQQVEKYVASLHAVDRPEKLELFEEFAYRERIPGYRRIVQRMKSWTSTSMYARQWVAMYQSYILTFQIHEIAHAALAHRPTPRPGRLLQNEAEADGFSRYVSNLVGQSTSPSISVLLNKLREKKVDLGVPGACRIEALATRLPEWRSKYFPEDRRLARIIRAPARAATALDRPFEFGLPKPEARYCRDYSAAFRSGMLKAAELVNLQTGLQVDNAWSRKCR